MNAKEPPLYQVNKIEFEKEAENEGCGRVQSRSESRKAEAERFLPEDGSKGQKKTERIQVEGGRFGKVSFRR